MNITPLDIRKQTFSKAFRGYEKEEVETFLEMVAEAFERLNEAHAALQSRAKNLESILEEYRRLEKTLQDTLIMAQKISEEAKENAHKEALLIIKEAELRADSILEEGRQSVGQVKQEMLTLQIERDTFIVRLKALCSGQLELLQVFTEKEYDEARAEPSDEVQIEPPIEYASISLAPDAVAEHSTLEDEQDEGASAFGEGEE